MLCENLVVSNSIDNTFDLSYSITPWPHFTLKESILCDMQLIILYFNNLSLSIVKKLSFVLSLDRGLFYYCESQTSFCLQVSGSNVIFFLFLFPL